MSISWPHASLDMYKNYSNYLKWTSPRKDPLKYDSSEEFSEQHKWLYIKYHMAFLNICIQTTKYFNEDIAHLVVHLDL